MALPRRHGEHVGTDRARDPGGEFLRPEGGLEQNEITGRETPFRRRVGMHLDPAVPRDLRNRIGKLLEPWLVGAAAIVENRMRENDDVLILAAGGGRGGKADSRKARGEPHRAGWSFSVDPALR